MVEKEHPMLVSSALGTTFFKITAYNEIALKIYVSGSQNSEILNGKRKLTLKMIRALHEKLNIPLESLIMPY